MKSLSWQKRLVILLVIVGVVLTVLFGIRTVRSFMHLRRMGPPRPEITDVEAIRGWMTVPFIARSYAVPEEYIFKWLDIPPILNRRHSLDDLNAAGKVGPLGNTIDSVKAAVTQFQQDLRFTPHPPLPPGP